MDSARPPGGLRAGQLSVIVLGRVIMGDVAVTLVDLALRELVSIEESGDGWIVRPWPASVPGHGQGPLLGYERTLLDGLAGAGTAPVLPEMAGSLAPALDKVRDGLVKTAVRQGWIRHGHHERTAKGHEIAAALGLFEHRLRRRRAEGGEQALMGSLLPYALHYALVSRDEVPLARFAGAWARALGDLPGWRPATPARGEFRDRGMYEPPLHLG